jgi:hypothetical protein
LQKKPFIKQIDLIDNDLISFITNSKEAKYQKTTDLNDKELGNLKETQITSLPQMLKLPSEFYDYQKNEDFENQPDETDEENEEEESKGPKKSKQ